jgi:hypothetical protein
MEADMRRVMVRYRVRPEHAAENERLVKAVYEELHRLQPDGFRYATFVQEDGVTFVHVATSDTEESARVLPGLAAFKRFQQRIRERCEDPPAVAELRDVGSFRFDPTEATDAAG